MLKINLTEINPFVRLVQQVTQKSANYYVPWRIIYDFELIFVTSGTLVIKTNSDFQKLKTGDFIIIPPFLRHKQEIPENGECSYYAMHMDFYQDKNFADFSWREVYSKPCEDHCETGIELEELNDRKIYEPEGIDLSVYIHIYDFDKMLKIFEKLYECFLNCSDISKIEIKAYALMLIATFFKELDNQQDDTVFVEKTVKTLSEYISDHFSERIDLVKLAQQYGFTPNYFRKVFRHLNDVGPCEYLINKRIEEAKKLLSLDCYTIQVVSLMVGYDDFHYFTRLFKKKEGVSPAKYGVEVKSLNSPN